jgi:hypothetical protein
MKPSISQQLQSGVECNVVCFGRPVTKHGTPEKKQQHKICNSVIYLQIATLTVGGVQQIADFELAKA